MKNLYIEPERCGLSALSVKVFYRVERIWRILLSTFLLAFLAHSSEAAWIRRLPSSFRSHFRRSTRDGFSDRGRLFSGSETSLEKAEPLRRREAVFLGCETQLERPRRLPFSFGRLRKLPHPFATAVGKSVLDKGEVEALVGRTTRTMMSCALWKLTNAEEEKMKSLKDTFIQLYVAFPRHVFPQNGPSVNDRPLGAVEAQGLYQIAVKLSQLQGWQHTKVVFPFENPRTVISAAHRGLVRVAKKEREGFAFLQYESGEALYPDLFNFCTRKGKSFYRWADNLQELLLEELRIEHRLEASTLQEVETRFRLTTAKDIILLPQWGPYNSPVPDCVVVNGFILRRPGLMNLKGLMLIFRTLQFYIPLAIIYARISVSVQILNIVKSVRAKQFVLPRLSVESFYLSREGIVFLADFLPLKHEKDKLCKEGDEKSQDSAISKNSYCRSVDSTLNSQDTAQILEDIWDHTSNFADRFPESSAGQRGARVANTTPYREHVSVIVEALRAGHLDLKDVARHADFMALTSVLS